MQERNKRYRTLHVKTVARLLLAGLVAIGGLTACEQKDTTGEGLAERAGRQIDRAAAGAAEQINKAADAAGETIEKAGGKLEDAAEDAQRRNEQKQESSNGG